MGLPVLGGNIIIDYCSFYLPYACLNFFRQASYYCSLWKNGKSN
ncbi:hypothetical protein HMPREF9370_0375 [Neisseria wadsworthii 9715]|uniref:Uncharacterized protein n=1 Tax=Neisseria wadsworthii 9715 TaxID=1030841 RepID=G4CMR6_9NEIS|nr:hypothetical protein HMPREF9370_0375 [Neisseria wadsworthii 9715]